MRDVFGSSVALDGNMALVGSHKDDDSVTDSGSAYLFGRNEGGTDNWGEIAKVIAFDGAARDQFGRDVTWMEIRSWLGLNGTMTTVPILARPISSA